MIRHVSGAMLTLSIGLGFSLSCAPQASVAIRAEAKVLEDEQKPEVLVERGKGFARLGDFTRAEQYFVQALVRGADEATVLPLLLRACIEGKRFRAALDHAEPALARHPDNHKLRLLAATLYAALGDNSRARGDYSKAIAGRPDDANARYLFAVHLRDAHHDRAAASQQFQAYLRLAPEGPHADEARGGLLKDIGIPIVIPIAIVPVASASAVTGPIRVPRTETSTAPPK